MAKNQALFNMVVKQMVARGAAKNVAEYVAAQSMYESAHGESSVAKKNEWNLSGIKFANQPGAVRGTKSPEGNHYAKFKTIAAWADAMEKILRRAPGQPWKATSLQAYVNGLVKNRYFTDSAGNYAKNLAAVYQMYTNVSPGVLVPMPPKPTIANPPTKGEMYRQAQEDVRDGTYQQQQQQYEEDRLKCKSLLDDLLDGGDLEFCNKKKVAWIGLGLLSTILLINLARR